MPACHVFGAMFAGGHKAQCGEELGELRRFGLVRGTSNVRVHDASLLPDAPGVNPQASVMAVAIRNTRRFLETNPPGGKAAA